MSFISLHYCIELFFLCVGFISLFNSNINNKYYNEAKIVVIGIFLCNVLNYIYAVMRYTMYNDDFIHFLNNGYVFLKMLISSVITCLVTLSYFNNKNNNNNEDVKNEMYIQYSFQFTLLFFIENVLFTIIITLFGRNRFYSNNNDSNNDSKKNNDSENINDDDIKRHIYVTQDELFDFKQIHERIFNDILYDIRLLKRVINDDSKNTPTVYAEYPYNEDSKQYECRLRVNKY